MKAEPLNRKEYENKLEEINSQEEINPEGKKIIKKILFGFLIFFGMFSAGVIGKYTMQGHWIGRVGELSVDWGIIIFTIGLLYIRRKIKKREKEEEKWAEESEQPVDNVEQQENTTLSSKDATNADGVQIKNKQD